VNIREAQHAAVEAVEQQLASGSPEIIIEGRAVSREAAWAATSAIRWCWAKGLRYDGQERAADGRWWARGEHPGSQALEVGCLGLFPGP
jgi:hypothetical protein